MPENLPVWFLKEKELTALGFSTFEKLVIVESIGFDNNYTGVWFAWHKNGAKSYQGTWIKDEPSGKHLSWHENGQKESVVIYTKGSVYSKESWDKDGRQQK